MLELVLANLKVRPFRTLISIIGVALGVILVVLFTSLANGMANDMAKRAANWKAEIVFTRPGAMVYDSSNASLNTAYADRLMKIDGVASTLPVIRYITADPTGRWGIRQIDGVDWQPFSEQNGINIVEGRAAEGLHEVVIDERQMKDDGLKIGDQIPLFGKHEYTVTGVFSPPSGARIKMSLAAMQDVLQTKNCTYILVKLKSGADVNAVAAKINEELPGNTVTLTQDMIINAQDRVPALKTFLRVMVALGAFVSTIFILLSLYTTVTERRREIGILKSLGASKMFIISSIVGEALMIGLLGIISGFALAFAASYLISHSFDLQFELSRGWAILAVIIAIGGSFIGALYPAWRASVIDPVEVMANE